VKIVEISHTFRTHMKASIILMKYREATDKGWPIYLQLRYKDRSGKHKIRKKSLKIHTLDEHWDHSNALPTQHHPNFFNLYPYFKELNARMIDLRLKDYRDAEQAMAFLTRYDRAPVASFDELLEKFASELEENHKMAKLIKWRSSVSVLRNYIGHTDIYDGISGDLLRFKKKMRNDGKTKGTVKTYLSSLRAMYNQGVSHGYIKDQKIFAGVFKDLHTPAYAKRPKYLDRKSLQLFRDAELSGTQSRARDIWMLSFYLGGQDLKDVYYL